ncbi:MAG: AMP-binding protein [Candidatus Omnitrophota bacterium]
MKTIPCPWSAAAKKFPHQPAFILKSRHVSYQQFDQICAKTLLTLKESGIKPNEHIAIVSPNSFEYVVLLVALWRLKAVAVPINTRLPEKGIAAALKKISGRKIFLAQKANLPFAQQFLIRDFIYPPCCCECEAKAQKISYDQDATIVFTSGSSGEPKAVLHSFANHFYNALGSNKNISLKIGDSWLLSLPLYHVGGLGILFRAALSGAAVIVPEENETLERSIKHYKPTHLSLVATQLYRLLLRRPDKNVGSRSSDLLDNASQSVGKNIIRDLQRMKAVLIGGSAIPENLIKGSFRQKIPIYLTYGLTEMASQVATTKKGSIDSAKPLQFRKLKIAKDGEILVKGETLFRGYVSGAKVARALTRDGWFPTGDLGRFDRSGALHILGRKDNMFISGGENIQPEEIERSLLKLPGISQTVVVPVKNNEFGFRPVAFIKTTHQAKINSERIKTVLRKTLPGFKIPDAFYPWPKDLKENLKMKRLSFLQMVGSCKVTLKKTF